MDDNIDNAILLKTNQFGELKVDNRYIFTFDEGILGFEFLKEYVLIEDEETAPFKWLLSVENPDIGFPLLNPLFLDNTYSPNKNFNPEAEAALVVITLGGEMGLMTANMKAPIILNVLDQTGKQIILPSDKYSTVHLIKPAK